MENKFNSGDIVRILSESEMTTLDWNEYPTVIEDMIKLFGKVVTIDRVIFDPAHKNYIYRVKEDDGFTWNEKWLTSLASPNLRESVVKFCKEVCILECSQECPLYKFKDDTSR